MISKISIRNFKSIKTLEIDIARVNVFVGIPNTGKSNILESIGTLSTPYTKRLEDFVRYEENTNLFYNSDILQNVKIDYYLTNDDFHSFEISYKYDVFEFLSKGALANCNFRLTSSIGATTSEFNNLPPIVKSYFFNRYKTFPDRHLEFLYPPSGKNLMFILSSYPEIKKHVSNLLQNFGYKLITDKSTSRIFIQGTEQNSDSLFPYWTISDTLQRMIFYYTVIETNKKSIIILEEPETHIFPFYIEQLALMIADNSNQFFIATHNPYFLNMLINKTPSESLRVFKVTSVDFQTVAKSIDKNTLQKFVINDNDILLNIERLGETE